MSTGLMNKLKWGNAIQVNGVPRHTDYAVCTGDVITVRLDEPPIQYPPQQGILDILYEDDHVLVVDKPAGMLIHPSRAKNTHTLANFVAGYYQTTGQRSAFHPVTRLDRDTFGVVLLAKHSHAHSRLQETALTKIYHAKTYGWIKADQGIIDAPIHRRPLPSMLRYVDPQGKPSQTRFRVIERDGVLCKLELQPITGRTHQLRVHCAHMGHPIVGDPQYGTQESMAYSNASGYHTQRLCAHSITFQHPINDEIITIQSHMEA